MDWVEPGGEEMYISNNSPRNLKIKIVLFQGSIQQQKTGEFEFSQTLTIPWMTSVKDNRLESSIVDLKEMLPNTDENFFVKVKYRKFQD